MEKNQQFFSAMPFEKGLSACRASALCPSKCFFFCQFEARVADDDVRENFVGDAKCRYESVQRDEKMIEEFGNFRWEFVICN